MLCASSRWVRDTVVFGVVWGLVGFNAYRAAAQVWVNPSGGNWFDFIGSNWSSGFPTSGTLPRFTSTAPGNFTVTMQGAAIGSFPTYQNFGLQVNQGTGHSVTLNLNGYSPPSLATGFSGYQLLSTSTTLGNESLLVGQSGVEGSLAITNGTMSSYMARIGSQTTGTMTVGQGALWKNFGGLDLGMNNGRGSLIVNKGGDVEVSPNIFSTIALGSNSSTDVGQIVVDGAGSTFTQHFGALQVGLSGTGSILVDNGASFYRSTASSMILGQSSSTSSGTLVVRNASLFQAVSSSTGQQFIVGNSGRGVFELLSGSTALIQQNVQIGNNVSSHAIIDGAGTNMVVTHGAFNPTVQIGNSGSTSSSRMTVSNAATATIDGPVTISASGILELGGGTVTASDLMLAAGRAQGHGQFLGRVAGTATIQASGGALVMGDSTQTNGFSFGGAIEVSSGATIDVRDSNAADLGALTTLNNGVFIARNGATLSASDSFSGHGIVIGSVTGPGSFSIATAPTGTVKAAAEFGASAGHVYSIGSANIGGSTIAGGSISATNGLTLAEQKSLSGHGAVTAAVTLNGGLLQATGGDLAVTGAVTGRGFVVEEPPHTVTATGGFTAVGTLAWEEDFDVAGNTVIVLSQGSAVLGPATTLAGGELIAANGVAIGGSKSLTGHGAVDGSVSAAPLSTITASGGNLELGNPNSFTGFSTGGELHVGSHVVTLRSRSFATLGTLTTIAGGTLSAPNGVALGAGGVLQAGSSVQGRVAAGFGSTIDAKGNLDLGDASRLDGYYSDGQLNTNEFEVTIQDKNEAVLGSLTTLGSGSIGGALTAGAALTTETTPHFLVEEGKNVAGRGEIDGNFKNNGHVVGDGPATLGERIVFNAPWIVSGKGTFENTLVFGTFAPGESPGVTDGKNQAFGGAFEFELGGLTAGDGANHHDQVNDLGTVTLLDGVDVLVRPYAGFLPTIGDSFEVLTWQDGLTGSLGDVLIDPWFAEQGLSFAPVVTNAAGPGSLTLVAQALALTADFNGDGQVDGADLSEWRAGFGDSEAPQASLDGRDFLSWQRSLGQGVPAAGAQIPEPTALGLIIAAVAGWTHLRTRTERPTSR